MSAKLPRTSDKGRCSRCFLQYRGKPVSKPEGFPVSNVCFRYDDYCTNVAWNCSTDSSSGFRVTDVLPELIDKLLTLKGEF